MDLKNIRMDLKGGRLLILDRSSVSFSNITLSNASLQVRSDNFQMEGCLFERSFISVELRSSRGITNSTYENTTVRVIGGTDVPVHNNRFMNSVLEMEDSANLDISNNLFYGRLPQACNSSSLYLNQIQYTGKMSRIQNNTFESCHWGLQAEDMGSMGPTMFYCVEVVGNYFRNCTYAMVLYYCNFYKVNIWANTFYHNGGTGNSGDGKQVWIEINEMPLGIANIFYHEGIGNCWWNYRTPDSDQDGIVDDPLLIDKDYEGFNHYDAYPLTDVYERLFRPRIEISSPKEGTYPFKDLEVRWNITNLKYDIVRREMKIDDGDWEELPKGSSMNMTFEKGEHTIILRAENEVGMVNQSSVSFTVSYDPSVLTILQPIDDAYIPDGKVHVEWVVREGFQVGEIKLSVGNRTYFPESGAGSMDIFLPDGRYLLQLTLTDIGGLSIDKEVTFNVDTTPPKVVIEGLGNGYVLSQRLVTINWSISDNMELISASYELNEGGMKELPITGRGTLKVFLDPGYHTISFLAVDAALHRDEVLIGFKIAEGTEGLLLEPQEGSMTNSDDVRVTWRDPDWMELSSIRISGNSLIQTQVLTGTNEAMVILPEDGLYELRVEFFDRSGNSYQERRTVTRDTWKPVLILPEEVIQFNTSSPSLNWTAFDDRLFGHFEVGLDGGPMLGQGLKQTFKKDGVADGHHTLIVKAVDMAGNSAEGHILFTIDTKPPITTIEGLRDGEVLTSRLLELTWNSQDENGIGTVRFGLDGQWSDMEISGTYMRGLGSGGHIFELNVMDLAGNWEQRTFRFLVDSERPILVWKEECSEYSNASIMVFGWQAHDDTMIVSTIVLVDGVDLRVPNVTNECEVALSEGKCSISVTVTDVAGRSTSIFRTVIVDRSAPSITNISISRIGSMNVLTVEVADGLSGISDLTVYYEGGKISTSDNILTIDLSDSASIQFQVFILVRDRAGNTIKERRTLTNEDTQKDDGEGSTNVLVFILVLIALTIVAFALFFYMKNSVHKDPSPTKEE